MTPVRLAFGQHSMELLFRRTPRTWLFLFQASAKPSRASASPKRDFLGIPSGLPKLHWCLSPSPRIDNDQIQATILKPFQSCQKVRSNTARAGSPAEDQQQVGTSSPDTLLRVAGSCFYRAPFNSITVMSKYWTFQGAGSPGKWARTARTKTCKGI